MAADEGGDIAVPDFSSKTMREVTEMCLHLGLRAAAGWKQSCYTTDSAGGSNGAARRQSHRAIWNSAAGQSGETGEVASQVQTLG